MDAGGNALVTGYTQSAGWTSGGFDTSHNGRGDAFVAKIGELEADTIDLRGTHVAAPLAVLEGDSFVVNWIVHNRGELATAPDAAWVDEVRLSTDRVWGNGDDTILGTRPHTGGLESDAAYNASLEIDPAAIPGGIPWGTYYVWVQADATDAIPEEPPANNARAAASTLQFGVPELVLDAPAGGVLSGNRATHYYVVNVTETGVLRVVLDDTNNVGSNELYVRYGQPPTRVVYDSRHTVNLAADQELVVPNAIPGTYYVMVYGGSVPDAPADYTVTASVSECLILGISPNIGANAGPVTMEIRGAGIPAGSAAKLLSPTGETVLGGIAGRDGDVIYATFDLAGAVPGLYDVALEATVPVWSINADGSTTQGDVTVSAALQGAFQVVQGCPGHFTAELVVPSNVRVGRVFPIQLIYGNDGLTDVPTPLLSIGAEGQAKVMFDQDGTRLSQLQFLAFSHLGPLNMLRPGVRESVTLYGISDWQGSERFSLVTTLPDGTPLDFDVLEGVLRPPIAPDSWEPIWSGFVQKAGSTWGSLLGAIAAAASTRSSSAGTQYTFYQGLLDLLGEPVSGFQGDSQVLPVPSAEVVAGTGLLSDPPSPQGDDGYTDSDYDRMWTVMRWIDNFGVVFPTAFGLLRYSLDNYSAPVELTDSDFAATEIKLSPEFIGVHGSVADGLREYVRAMCEGLPDGESTLQYALPAINVEMDYYSPLTLDLAIAFGHAQLRTGARDGDLAAPISVVKSPLVGGYSLVYYSADVQYVQSDRYVFTSERGPKTVLDVPELNPSEWFNFLCVIDHTMYHLQQAGRASIFDDYVSLKKNVSGWMICKDEEPPVPTPPTGPGGGRSTQVLGAWDPNDKSGPSGVGDGRSTLPGALMPYTVFYENDETKATCPASLVEVEDQLDADLDWSTFELGDINLYGDFWVDVPEGRQYYYQVVDLRPEGKDVLVEVEAGLDPSTGIVRWTFQTLDPDTLEEPLDPFRGFLSHLADGRANEGKVEYMVRARADLATGATITNYATSTFDRVSTDTTPTVLNTIDAGAPTSDITTPDGSQGRSGIQLQWQGQDDPGGSGIASYDLYVSVDGAPYGLAQGNLTGTTATYMGGPNHTYRFYTVATDPLGHRETAPAEPDVVITTWPTEQFFLQGKTNKRSFTDTDGTPVTITFAGPGAATVERWVNPADPPATARGDIRNITVANSTTKSGLTISTKGVGAAAETTVEDVTVNGSLAKLDAKTADLLGNLTVTGGLGTLTLDDVVAQHALSIGSDPLIASLSVTFDQVSDLSIDSDTPIKSITATEWLDSDSTPDTVSAPWLGTLTTKGRKADQKKGIAALAGDFEAGLTLDGTGNPKQTLGTAKIAGDLPNATWDITGNVGSITADDADGWTLNVHSTLKSLKLNQASDTTITVDGPIGSVTVAEWDTGSLEAGSLGSLKVTGNKKALLVGDFDADLTLDTPVPKKSTLGSAKIAGSVSDGVWNVTGDVGSVSVTGDFGGEIHAQSVKSVSVKGNMDGATLDLARGLDPLSPKLMALARLSVTGWIQDSVVTTPGHIGSVTAGGMKNSSLFAGVATARDDLGMGAAADGVFDLPDLADLTPAAGGLVAGIKSVTIKGIKVGKVYQDSFINTNIAAGSLGKVTLCYAKLDNDGNVSATDVPFGPLSGTALGFRVSYRDADPTHKFAWKAGQLLPAWLAETDLMIECG